MDRLTRHFYWVGVSKVSRAFCRNCDVCQCLGKGASPQRAPLINLPLIDNIVYTIAIGIVYHEIQCLVCHAFILIVMMSLLMSLLWFEYKVAQLKSRLKGVGMTFPAAGNQLMSWKSWPWKSITYREKPVEEFAVSLSHLVFGGNTQGVIQFVTQSCCNDYVLQLRESIRSSLKTLPDFLFVCFLVALPVLVVFGYFSPSSPP